MKICILTYRGNPFCGGQGVYVSALAGELAQQGHEVHCISGPPYLPEVPGVTQHRVPGLQLYGGNSNPSNGQSSNHTTHTTPNPHATNGNGAWGGGPLWAFTPLNLYDRAAFQTGIFSEMTTFSFRAFWLLRRLLETHRFDIIHDNQTLAWGLLPMKSLGVPLFATIHHPLSEDRQRGFEPPSSFARQWGGMLFYPLVMQGFVARRLSRVVTVSHAAARKIELDFRVPKQKISVVYNGVDTRVFRPIPRIRRKPGLILFVGNIEDPNKGGIHLLRAMALVRPPARLEIVTGGISDPEKFHATLEELGIAGRVKVHYRLSGEELAERYASAQVAVSPSVYEGFGFPAAEAMACEVPLVAARGGALPEVVGEAGLTVPVRDPGALAEALENMLGDATLRKRLGRAGRKRVLARFQWSQAAKELAGIYGEVIDAHRRF